MLRDQRARLPCEEFVVICFRLSAQGVGHVAARLVSTMFAAALTAGCSVTDGPSVQSQVALMAAQAATQAERLERAGEGHQALQQWLIVDALQPGHPSARARATALALTLKQRSEQLEAQARQAQRQGRSRTARKLLLQALAAQPADATLRQQLVDLESGRQLRMLEARLAKTASATRKADQRAMERIATPLSPQAREAERLYQRAIDTLDDNPAAARALLQQVLQLVPTHLGARAYLESLP